MSENLEIQKGYCQCGCGVKTTVFYGRHRRYISGHNSRYKTSPNWNGGIYNKSGYRFIKDYNHPKRSPNNYIPEQVLIVEKIIGKFLPEKSVVHHVNSIRDDNRNSNLVLCEDASYHLLLHVRTRAFLACGNPRWRKCWICKQYDDPQNMSMKYKSNPYKGFQHSVCVNNYNKIKIKARKHMGGQNAGQNQQQL